ncbi:homoserine dehydrogenase [Brevibacillus dissolubilis]|uniref:homoserine dehydrogenase n=1 Tax=Brevibacillus dissolubilis TaxID=1844116 RepID=UPI001115B73A|nr:homoserine dehydrogenase [Brevibacillus dissolubilis]
MKTWNIAITGFGNVGWHVADLLAQRQAYYLDTYQADVRLIAASNSKGGIYQADGLPWQELTPLTRANGGVSASPNFSAEHTGVSFLQKSGADVLIEAGPTDFETGGAGYGYIKAALSQGMHAVSISKGALVYDYHGLAALAKSKRAMLKISGATAAALPTIDLVTYNAAGCTVGEMTGIFTGTTNFILTRMMEDGVTYETALAEAQSRGIAEPDPSFDVEGWDTACKVTILANAAFGADVKLTDIKREGISGVTPQDIAKWKQDHVVPKLVGQIRRTEAGVQAEVGLRLFSVEHPFTQVKGSTKAIQITTDVMGELLVIGGKSDPRAAAAAALKDFEHILGRFS